MSHPWDALEAKLRAAWESACEAGEVCMACGRASDFISGGAAWCHACSRAAYAEQRADALAQSDDAADRLHGRKLLRAGVVPVASMEARTRDRAGGNPGRKG